MNSLSLLLVFILCLIYNTFSLCSWNRAIQPIDDEYEYTLNFVNGEWIKSTEQVVEILNGQPYWKKTLYDNCGGDYQNPNDESTIWLYYYVGIDSDEGQWIISPYWNTKNNVYAKCGKDLPNPTDVTKCNGHWLFAEDGEPILNGSYIIDTSFNFRPGACPQLTCERIQLITDSDDPFVGVYYRQSRIDRATQNVYIQSNEASDTGLWYLYFNDNIFSWMINDDINRDCSAVTDGTLTSIAEINSWPEISALDNQSWPYYATDATTETRTILCFGQIPTSDPTASDATGYPSPAPIGSNEDTTTDTPTVQIYDRSNIPTRYVNWPTVPTLGPTSPTGAPTTPTTYDYQSKSNSLNCKLSLHIFIILAVYILL